MEVTMALLYGLLAITVINLTAVLGAVFVPFQKRAFYGTIISFLMALAVGALSSTAALVLIPEALALNPKDVSEINNPALKRYRSIMCMVFVGILLFYILEHIIRRIAMCVNSRRGDNQSSDFLHHNHQHAPAPNQIDFSSSKNAAISNGSSVTPKILQVELVREIGDEHSIQAKSVKSSIELTPANPMLQKTTLVNEMVVKAPRSNSNAVTHMSWVFKVPPIVWMIVLGDAVHNFMDGVAIGAGFKQNALTGLSLSLGVFFEEFPHELGDFAVLIHSGLSIKRVMMLQLISAATAYIGLILGILIGDEGNASRYVFAATAGLFLYISLSDMLPELRETLDGLMKSQASIDSTPKQSVTKLFLLHCLGLCAGFGCIVAIQAISFYYFDFAS